MKKFTIIALTASLLFTNVAISFAASHLANEGNGQNGHPYGDDMRSLPTDSDPTVVRIQPVGEKRLINVDVDAVGQVVFHEKNGKVIKITNKKGEELKLTPAKSVKKSSKKAHY